MSPFQAVFGAIQRREIPLCTVSPRIASALHQACHYIYLDSAHREEIDTDAGGDYDEENAVCYLQILLVAKLPGCSADILMNNMDSWCYAFRLGSAKAWFQNDAADAQQWLLKEQLIDQKNILSGRLRR